MPRAEDPIPMAVENVGDEFPHRILIIHDQYIQLPGFFFGPG
jgi:hypothetical protein